MRTKKQILSDYSDYLKERGQDISKLTYNEQYELLIAHLNKTKKHKGQLINSPESWRIFVDVVVRYDHKTGYRLWNSFVKESYEIMEFNQLSCVMATRGVGKSLRSILYVLFKQFLYEDVDVLWVSNIPSIARRNIRSLRRFVDSNEILLTKKDPNSKTAKWGDKEVQYNGGYIETLSVGSTPRGAHVPLIMLDDPLRDDNRYSNSYMDNFVFSQLLPAVLSNKGRMTISGTPIREDDLLHKAMNDKEDLQGKLIKDGGVSALGFYSKCFPAITNWETKEVSVPERYTYDDLMRIRRSVGEMTFAREYQLQCIADDAQIFPSGIIRRCISQEEGWLENGKKGGVYVIGVDLASSASKAADFTCFVVIEFDEDTGRKYVRQLVNEKMTAEEQEERLYQMSKDFNDAFVYIEKNNMGEFLYQKMIDRNVNVESFTTSTLSKQNFIRFLRTELVNRKIIFPPLEGYYEIVKEQLTSFGYREKAGRKVMEALRGHDDIVMALSAANIATQKYGDYNQAPILLKR